MYAHACSYLLMSVHVCVQTYVKFWLIEYLKMYETGANDEKEQSYFDALAYFTCSEAE
jgi:hypothetical protein